MGRRQLEGSGEALHLRHNPQSPRPLKAPQLDASSLNLLLPLARRKWLLYHARDQHDDNKGVIRDYLNSVLPRLCLLLSMYRTLLSTTLSFHSRSALFVS